MSNNLRPFRGRLAQFKVWTNRDEDWEKCWDDRGADVACEYWAQAYLGEYEILTRYLHKDLPVLEAGCGMGTVVAALAARGYRAEGVDYSEKTIRRVQDAFPALNVRVGDIYHLDVPDETYGGYISLGVLEHNPDGPLEGLREARRVLRPEGVAFISTPFLNAKRARILKKQLGETDTRESIDGVGFYQYYYSSEEFGRYLDMAGFHLVELLPLGVKWALAYDYPWVKWLWERGCFHWRLRAIYNACCSKAPRPIRGYYAHMMGYVCKRA